MHQWPVENATPKLWRMGQAQQPGFRRAKRRHSRNGSAGLDDELVRQFDGLRADLQAMCH
jgi:hypothetical protein